MRLIRRRSAPHASGRLIATSAGIGAIAGLRSLTAPAVVGWAINQKWIKSPTGWLLFLQKKITVSVLSALAAGELVADKLPSTPNRTEPIGLAARALTGGLSAGALCASKKKLIAAGAIAGAMAGVCGAFVGYQVRRQLREKLHLNDVALAVAEDAIAVGGGVWLVRSM